MEHSVSFVPQLSPQEVVPKNIIDHNEMTDHDIYRGVQYPTSRALDPDSASSQGSSSTTSYNTFHLSGGRLSAIATRLERAITRWARANWADSSSSFNQDTASESSRSSFRTANKSTHRKRRRSSRSSVVDIQQHALYERTVAARLRVREARRTMPREFNLYSPSANDHSLDPGPVEGGQQAVRTFSLDSMLPHLENLLHKHGKSRRLRHHGRTTMISELDYPHQSHSHHANQGCTPRNGVSEVPRADAPNKASQHMEKGKNKAPSATPPSLNALKYPSPPLRDSEAGRPAPAWWLDVANPSWEDMRTLGKVSTPFHLE